MENPYREFGLAASPAVSVAAGPEGAWLAALESSPDGLLLLDMDGRTHWCNGPLARLLGLACPEALPRAAKERDAWLAELLQADVGANASLPVLPVPQSGECLLVLRDGRWLERRHGDWVSQGRKLGLLVHWRDVSQAQLDRLAAGQQQHWMSALMEGLPDPIGFKDVDSRYLAVNSALAARLGLAHPREALGRSDADFYAPDYAERVAEEEREIMRSGHGITDRQEQEVWADRRSCWIVRTKIPLRDAQGRVVGTFGISYDISRQKQNEALIWEQANFDVLTGLPNRRMLSDRWEQACKHAQRKGLGMALLMLDLDHFKDVNDTLGHARGDELLVEAAARIKSVVRESDVVARLGGDEFCVILTELAASAHVGDIAQKIVTTLARPFQLGQDQAYVSASIGIALYPSDSTEIATLFQQADNALYDAKGHGRNGFRFFTADMQAQALERVRLGHDLRQALMQDQFFLVFQPIVQLASGQAGKVEALLRWRHPQRGVLGPRAFIAIAETSGLLTEISEWVMRSAARQLHDWRQRISPDLHVTINKSPLQSNRLGSHVVADWHEHLRSLGLLSGAVVVEITEGQLLEPDDKVGRHLQALREVGVSISLDDFGTGFSSLSGLQHYAIDFIKIDQSFVRELGQDGNSLALCKAIISMAHELGMEVIAEGVETEQQRDLLAAAGCDHAQGYFYTQPLAAPEMERWLNERL